MRAEFVSILNHDEQYQNALKQYNDIFTPAVLQSLDSVGSDYQTSRDDSYSYIWKQHTEEIRMDAHIAYHDSGIFDLDVSTEHAIQSWQFSTL